MSITANDIKWKQAEENSDLSSNGGRMTAAAVTAGLLRDITGAERAAGVTLYRKLFAKQEQSDVDGKVDLSLLSSKAYLKHITPAGDRILLAAGTATDTQSAAEGYTGWAGVGTLDIDEVLGATEIDVYPDGGQQEGFADPTTIVIFKADDPNVIQFIPVTGAVWNAGSSTYTLTLQNSLAYDFPRAAVSVANPNIITSSSFGKTTANFGLTNSKVGLFARVTAGPGLGQIRKIVSNTTTICNIDYPWNPLDMPDATSTIEIISTFVATTVSLGTIVASFDGWGESSVAGTFDEATYPPELFPAGCISSQYQIEFTALNTAQVRRVYDNTVILTNVDISVGQRVEGNYIAPGTVGQYAFRLALLGFTGDWDVGDTITFTTHASAKSVWMKVIAGANIDAYGGNPWDIGLAGDTA